MVMLSFDYRRIIRAELAFGMFMMVFVENLTIVEVPKENIACYCLSMNTSVY